MTAFPPPFDTPYGTDDTAIAARLLNGTFLKSERERAIDMQAGDLAEAIRKSSGLSIEELLCEYSLSTKEGLALMVLAEALLRVPDAATADSLIEDKLKTGGFRSHERRSGTWLMNAAAVALGASVRLIKPGETPSNILGQLVKRMGVPTIRTAAKRAVHILGNQFVLGENIDAALRHAKMSAHTRYSFDMLGEAARTSADAERYFTIYANAIDAIGKVAGKHPLPVRPGISIKLSALHPRFEAVNREHVLHELVPLVVELARKARDYELNFTIDAEEADRLELTLEVIGAAFAEHSLENWDGFGFAVQAYQKRASAVIAWAGELAERYNRRMMLRLVKGAYWDTEIKRAQERGLQDYPVFTRKCMTDLYYITCAEQLLALRPKIFPQFATHNALTVATVLDRAAGDDNLEFQRLYGMGEALYKRLHETSPEIACRIYAPVGGHRELLAYLVRRMLENGANSSFVSAAADPKVPLEKLLQRPATTLSKPQESRHPRIPLPSGLFGSSRTNSRGVELGHRSSLAGLLAEIAAHPQPMNVSSLLNGKSVEGNKATLISPIDATTIIGDAIESSPETASQFAAAAKAGFSEWNKTPTAARADVLELAANLLEVRRGTFLRLLQVEAGKTVDDAVGELRRAVDFCRYYATEGRRLFNEGTDLPGPTGEANRLRLHGRGPFVCISPWNFPLSTFLGQITAALMAGNTVIAKPARQTPLISFAAVDLLHDAGIPTKALHLALGDAHLGEALVKQPDVVGVAFTGSTAVAHHINQTIASRSGPIVPFIATTSGINVMIADATALPEQLTDDVLSSAFRSAGQRFSSLRLLCIQEDIADTVIAMIAGAARELHIGDPRDPATHIGPVIDAEAKQRLETGITDLKQKGRLHFAGVTPRQGTYVAPHIFEIDHVQDLTREVFGPVLHVVRYKVAELDQLLDALNTNGYGLTLGVQSRVYEKIDYIVNRLQASNVYVNRNMLGSVVGVQPFGGQGLAGTGPKIGGPNYLPRFAAEQTITINLTSAGVNTSLYMDVE